VLCCVVLSVRSKESYNWMKEHFLPKNSTPLDACNVLSKQDAVLAATVRRMVQYSGE